MKSCGHQKNRYCPLNAGAKTKFRRIFLQLLRELFGHEKGNFTGATHQFVIAFKKLDDENRKLEAEQRRLEAERAALAKKKALNEKRRQIEEEKERLAAEQEEQRQTEAERKGVKKGRTLAMSKRPAAPTAS